MKWIILAAIALIAMPLTVIAGDDAEAKREFKALEGKWKVVAITEAGKEVPTDKLPAISIVFRADGTATRQMPNEEIKCTLTLDLAKKPKRMMVAHESGSEKGQKQYAIYKLEGDKFTAFFSQLGAPEEDRPADFNAKDAKASLMVFERVKNDMKP
jgi:uncharacterized protein (TIGR03067 family)